MAQQQQHSTTGTKAQTIPRTVAEFDRQAAGLGKQISETQAAHRTVEAELEAARARYGQAGSNLLVARRNDVGNVLRHEAAVSAAGRNIEAVQASRMSSEERVRSLHVALNDVHRARRQYLALGGREMPAVSIPDIRRDDAPLAALQRQATELGAKCQAARGPIEAARLRALEQSQRVSLMRPKIHLGEVTAAELATAEKTLQEVEDAHAELEQDYGALCDAAAVVEERRRAREHQVVGQHLPALQAEYQNRLQVFADALREAAIACEAVWPVFEALHGPTNVSVQPWHELRVGADDSKFMAWMREAMDAGLVE